MRKKQTGGRALHFNGVVQFVVVFLTLDIDQLFFIVTHGFYLPGVKDCRYRRENNKPLCMTDR